jgi:hypothetical protein
MNTISGSRERDRLWPIASGLRQLDPERGIGSDQPLNIERGVSGKETLNVELEVAGECQVHNHRGQISQRDGRVE